MNSRLCEEKKALCVITEHLFLHQGAPFWNRYKNGYQHPEAHSELWQTSKMNHLANIVNIVNYSFIRLWHHCISYYNVAIFTLNIIFTTTSFAPLCLLLTFDLRFIKINSTFSKLLFTFYAWPWLSSYHSCKP